MSFPYSASDARRSAQHATSRPSAPCQGADGGHSWLSHNRDWLDGHSANPRDDLRVIVGHHALRRRALVDAAVAGAIAIAGIFVLRSDSHRLFSHLLGPGLPLVALSAVAGLTALLSLGSLSRRGVRVLAVTAVGSVVAGWGVAQYPYLLGTHLSIGSAAAPQGTLVSVAVIFLVAAVVVIPALAFLYVLEQRPTGRDLTVRIR